MLDKKDLDAIEKLFKKNLQTGLEEFFETIVLPYFESNEADHKELKENVKEIVSKVKSHEKRIVELESASAI